MSFTELTGNPRHDQLLSLVGERGYMNIDELAGLLDVSTQTVRRDIRKLSEQGLITRHHGGAGRASSVVNTAFEQREVSWTQEKKSHRGSGGGLHSRWFNGVHHHWHYRRAGGAGVVEPQSSAYHHQQPSGCAYSL